MWLRLDEHLPSNAKVQSLSPELFKFWINLLCLCRSTNGVVPDPKDIAWNLRISHSGTKSGVERAIWFLTELVNGGLIDRSMESNGTLLIHDWHSWQYTSDNSTPRVKRFRERLHAVSRNAPEQSRADTEQKPPLPPLPDSAFDRLWASWKKPGPRILAEQYFSQSESQAQIVRGLSHWAEWYTRTGGWRYCKQNLAEAIHERTWMTPAPEDPAVAALKADDVPSYLEPFSGIAGPHGEPNWNEEKQRRHDEKCTICQNETTT